MSGSQLTPAQLDQVRELHGVVRDWIERSAVAQNNEHLRASLPYVDLMFAFGFATLGDHPTANALVEAARKVLEGPIPEGGSPQAEQAVTAAVVRNFLFKALRYRVGQALSRKSHTGSLSAEVLSDRDAIEVRCRSGPVNNPYKLAAHVIDRFRSESRTAEPQERIDPYISFGNPDPLKIALSRLHAVSDPATFVGAVRSLLSEGVKGMRTPLAAARLEVLYTVLPRAEQGGEAFTIELLKLVPDALRTNPDAAPVREVELLKSALALAAQLCQVEVVRELVDFVQGFIQSAKEDSRAWIVSRLAGSCLATVNELGLTSEAERLMTVFRAEVVPGASLSVLRTMFTTKPERWAPILRARFSLPGTEDPAEPTLEAVRQVLLGAEPFLYMTKDFVDLARSYVAALAKTATGLSGMIELFRNMHPTRITNTWTTAQYYSRFHLELVEDTVFAVCQLCQNNPTPAIVSA